MKKWKNYIDQNLHTVKEYYVFPKGNSDVTSEHSVSEFDYCNVLARSKMMIMNYI